MNEKVILRHGKSDHIEVFDYPDGQSNVKLDLEYFNDRKVPIDITCSIRNMRELEVLLCVVAAFRQNDFVIHSISFVYLFGCRSDRAFEPGMPNYFRDVIAPIIKSLNCELRFLKPHGRAQHYINPEHWRRRQVYCDTSILKINSKIAIAGDESAVSLLTDLKSWGCNENVFHFHKSRTEGKLLVFLEREFRNKIESMEENTIIIVDDLCDGGATFLAEAQYLKEHFPYKNIQLFVYHGLFNKGFDELFKYFERIYCTNSYQDFPQNPNDPLHIPKERLRVIEVI